jgi:hypothetical protein
VATRRADKAPEIRLIDISDPPASFSSLPGRCHLLSYQWGSQSSLAHSSLTPLHAERSAANDLPSLASPTTTARYDIASSTLLSSILAKGMCCLRASRSGTPPPATGTSTGTPATTLGEGEAKATDVDMMIKVFLEYSGTAKLTMRVPHATSTLFAGGGMSDSRLPLCGHTVFDIVGELAPTAHGVPSGHLHPVRLSFRR